MKNVSEKEKITDGSNSSEIKSTSQDELKLMYVLIDKNKKLADEKFESVVQQVKESETRNKKRIKKAIQA